MQHGGGTLRCGYQFYQQPINRNLSLSRHVISSWRRERRKSTSLMGCYARKKSVRIRECRYPSDSSQNPCVVVGVPSDIDKPLIWPHVAVERHWVSILPNDWLYDNAAIRIILNSFLKSLLKSFACFIDNNRVNNKFLI